MYPLIKCKICTYLIKLRGVKYIKKVQKLHFLNANMAPQIRRTGRVIACVHWGGLIPTTLCGAAHVFVLPDSMRCLNNCPLAAAVPAAPLPLTARGGRKETPGFPASSAVPFVCAAKASHYLYTLTEHLRSARAADAFRPDFFSQAPNNLSSTPAFPRRPVRALA